MPDRNDAMLLVELAQLATAMGLDDAIGELFKPDFDPESATIDGNAAVRKALEFGETVGTLTKHHLFDTELALDWLWVAGIWSRVGPAALRQREELGAPALYENFEALAERQAE